MKDQSILKDALVAAFGDAAASVRVEGARPSIAAMFCVPVARFAEAGKVMKACDARLAAEWAVDETVFGGGFGIMALYGKGVELLLIECAVPHEAPVFPSLTGNYLAAWRFERQMRSLMGVESAGHPDARPWIKHEDWPPEAYPLRKAFDAKTRLARVQGEYKWVRAEGEGVYEIAVGPVHAGIIEPGHFRFQAVGEDIINLEERLGYVHKGIEKRFESMTWAAASRLAGRVSGDTTVAHATGYCTALEAAAGCEVPARAAWLRALLLERERIANHVGDIGAISNDAAFTFLLYQTAILRERLLRTNQAIFGHRLTMDIVMPGGVNADITLEAARVISGELTEFSAEFERLVAIYEETPSLEDRTCNAGVLAPPLAKEMGVVGIVARASNQPLDARVQQAYPPYDVIAPKLIRCGDGDVNARIQVRIDEVRESIRLIRAIIDGMPEGPLAVDCPAPRPGATGISVVEGWRGEIVWWVQAGPGSEINRVMVRDPSSVNWLALEQAIKGNIVPDFPLCNKSFNQSYSGNDL
ncbi:MAG: NADH-quinone oxidoreductase subunit C [Deltaproteobacteria bacterium]|nr:NADH-quinone oxidoreductase subunit C [Deltaproteobacteria bacterium]